MGNIHSRQGRINFFLVCYGHFRITVYNFLRYQDIIWIFCNVSTETLWMIYSEKANARPLCVTSVRQWSTSDLCID